MSNVMCVQDDAKTLCNIESETPTSNCSCGKLVGTTANADGASTEQTHWGLNTSITHVMEIIIAHVNTAPTFTMLTSGVRACYNFPAFNGTVADNISAGPFEEQAIEFIVTLVDGDSRLFSKFPTIDANGRLNFAISANISGSAVFSITLADSGGTKNGGRNFSTSSNFTVVVDKLLRLNLSPVVYTVLEDSASTFVQLLVRVYDCVAF
jgi:hypothetical protein